jgi:hypothetical protein
MPNEWMEPDVAGISVAHRMGSRVGRS